MNRLKSLDQDFEDALSPTWPDESSNGFFGYAHETWFGRLRPHRAKAHAPPAKVSRRFFIKQDFCVPMSGVLRDERVKIVQSGAISFENLQETAVNIEKQARNIAAMIVVPRLSQNRLELVVGKVLPCRTYIKELMHPLRIKKHALTVA